MSSLSDTLLDLVRIKSVTGDEGRLVTTISERLFQSVGREATERIGNNLIVGRRTGKRLLLLVGHLDTVPAQVDRAPYIEGDLLFGLGASDMKSGLAVMIHLLEDPDIVAGPYDVVGVFYDREEGPAEDNGLAILLREGPWLTEAEFAVVLEPTGLEIQLGCVGGINARVAFTGSSAHSARPWLGENAITRAGEWLASQHRRRRVPVDVSGLEFYEVATVTVAEGGIATNVVPPRFEINVNYRFAPNMTLDEAEDKLRELLDGVDEVEILDQAPPGPVPENNEHLDRLKSLSGASVAPKQGWTDVARLAQVGVDAVNYGPGDPAQAHQATENAPLGAMDEAFSVLKELLTES
ncbi:MAG: succinyl-diaminopimelate desuccinylase [Acidimicrobiia bacterium]